MASLRWHKLNNTVCEIIRTTEKLEIAMCHCMTHKNSSVQEMIPKLSEKREKLYEDSIKQCEDWIKTIDEKEGSKNDNEALTEPRSKD